MIGLSFRLAQVLVALVAILVGLILWPFEVAYRRASIRRLCLWLKCRTIGHAPGWCCEWCPRQKLDGTFWRPTLWRRHYRTGRP